MYLLYILEHNQGIAQCSIGCTDSSIVSSEFFVSHDDSPCMIRGALSPQVWDSLFHSAGFQDSKVTALVCLDGIVQFGAMCREKLDAVVVIGIVRSGDDDPGL